MKLKLVLALSLLVNLVLGIHAVRKSGEAPAAAAQAGRAADAAREPGPAEVISETIARTEFRQITWEMVESPDYKEYIANLRTIGCPDETIRDIILADVNKLYDEKKKQARGAPKRFEFWKGGNPFFGSVDTEVMRQIRELDEERDGVLRALGIEPDFKSQMAQAFNPFDAMMDFLPEEKKAQVMKLFTDMQGSMAKAMEDGAPDPDAFAKAQKELEEAVHRLLTPEEALDFDLRFSMTANIMRTQIAGFDPNEDEFLDLFKLRKSFDDEFHPMARGNETEEQSKQRQEAQNQLDEQIKLALGPERFEDYQRSQDWAFQQIYRSVRQADLGTAEAAKVYDMKNVAEEEARRVRMDSNLSQEQRNAALEAIHEQTEQSLQQVLGERGWEHYNRPNNTHWLRNLNPNR